MKHIWQRFHSPKTKTIEIGHCFNKNRGFAISCDITRDCCVASRQYFSWWRWCWWRRRGGLHWQGEWQRPQQQRWRWLQYQHGDNEVVLNRIISPSNGERNHGFTRRKTTTKIMTVGSTRVGTPLPLRLYKVAQLQQTTISGHRLIMGTERRFAPTNWLIVSLWWKMRTISL